MLQNSEEYTEVEEKPPVFQKWKSWYWLVMGNLAILIILFLLLNRAYQ